MLIRQRIVLGCGFGTLAVVIAVVYLLWVQEQARRLDDLAAESAGIATEVAGLLAATSDLDRAPWQRAALQWRARHESIGRRLSTLAEGLTGNDARRRLAGLRAEHRALATLYERLGASPFPRGSEEFRLQAAVVVGRLVSEAQLMAEDAVQLQRIVNRRSAATDRTSRWSAIAVLALLAGLLLGGALLIMRRVLRPLAALDVAARYAARRDYGRAHIDIGDGDEFGRAGTAFNRMVATVQQRERALEQSLEALQQRNQDLDEFAHVASHDLKAPLNAIEQLTEWIANDNAESLPPESREHLQLMQGRVARMKALLSDMLAYARAGREQTPSEEIDVAATARRVFDLMVVEGFELEVSDTDLRPDLPRVPFEQVLRNLFSNAVKHHDGNQGRIALSMERLPEGWRFAVTDDGPGIDPAFHQRVFGMFQTLKPRDVREGSGMGLALVRKLIRYYSGTIGIDSDGRRGTTVWFTWPHPALNNGTAGDRGGSEP